VGQKGAWLSGGQRQRLALARALVSTAPILILDEATSSVDAASERLIQESLERFRGKRTVVVIAHRLSTVVGADRIVVLDHGEIVEQGTHADLMLRDGAYATLFGIQAAGLSIAPTPGSNGVAPWPGRPTRTVA
jgi:ATP-binding cassette subfamily C protein CydCD